jgi:hypothetical protein
MTHKSYENLSFEVQNVQVRDEDFSCSLDVLYGGLGISKLQLEKLKLNNFFIFFKYLVIKTLDLDPHRLKMLDPDPNPH